MKNKNFQKKGYEMMKIPDFLEIFLLMVASLCILMKGIFTES